MSAPRLLILGLKWPPETFIMRLIDGLARRELDVTVAVDERPTAGPALPPNVRLVRLPGVVGRRLRRSPLTGGYDALYFPWNTSAIVYQSLLDEAPSVISCRGSQINVAPHNPERAALREGLALTFGKATAVHCVSQQIRDEAARYGLDPRKAVVIRPAVDPNLFRPALPPPSERGSAVPSPFGRGLGRGSSSPDTPFRLVTTGSILWRKGYEYALLAVRQLVERGLPVRFDIIGDGPEGQRLLYTIHDLGLQEHVVWHGPLPPAAVVGRLQAADVFLLTSLSEGISNAVLEAMACGLPVVTTDVDGLPEAVGDGVEGFLVPPRDPAATADALARLAASPELRQRMGQAGRHRVLADFRLDDQADAFAGLFRKVAAT